MTKEKLQSGWRDYCKVVMVLLLLRHRYNAILRDIVIVQHGYSAFSAVL